MEKINLTPRTIGLSNLASDLWHICRYTLPSPSKNETREYLKPKNMKGRQYFFHVTCITLKFTICSHFYYKETCFFGCTTPHSCLLGIGLFPLLKKPTNFDQSKRDFFLLISNIYTLWILNPRPHPPPCTYKGRRCHLN